jgi:hypothetical protein
MSPPSTADERESATDTGTRETPRPLDEPVPVETSGRLRLRPEDGE